jgi:hypothetical protein
MLKLKPFDINKYAKYTPAQLHCIKHATAAIYKAILSNDPAKTAEREAAISRKSCHPKPNKGKYVQVVKQFRRGRLGKIR